MVRGISMQQKPVKKPWIMELEYLRGMAMVAVICHVFIPTPDWRIGISFNVNETVMTINNFIFTWTGFFAVPLFISMTGFVLSYNYPDGSFNIPGFLKRRLESVLPPYVIFSLVSIAGLAMINGFPGIVEIIIKLFTASANNTYWFFAILIQFYVFYPWIIKLYDYFSRKNKVLLLFLILLVIQWMWMVYSPLLFGEDYGFTMERIFITHITYFIAGIYASQNYSTVSKLLLKQSLPLFLFISVLIIVLLDFDSALGISRFITVICRIAGFFIFFVIAFKIAINLAQKNSIASRIIYALGQHSFGIFLINPFVTYIAVILIFKVCNLDHNVWFFYLVIYIITLTMSFVYAYLISYLPYSKYIIGRARAGRRA
jgi:peptidoglycan/LPS O-acetylase OafA/YrhL